MAAPYPTPLELASWSPIQFDEFVKQVNYEGYFRYFSEIPGLDRPASLTQLKRSFPTRYGTDYSSFDGDRALRYIVDFIRNKMDHTAHLCLYVHLQLIVLLAPYFVQDRQPLELLARLGQDILSTDSEIMVDFLMQDLMARQGRDPTFIGRFVDQLITLQSVTAFYWNPTSTVKFLTEFSEFLTPHQKACVHGYMNGEYQNLTQLKVWVIQTDDLKLFGLLGYDQQVSLLVEIIDRGALRCRQKLLDDQVPLSSTELLKMAPQIRGNMSWQLFLDFMGVLSPGLFYRVLQTLDVGQIADFMEAVNLIKLINSDQSEEMSQWKTSVNHRTPDPLAPEGVQALMAILTRESNTQSLSRRCLNLITLELLSHIWISEFQTLLLGQTIKPITERTTLFDHMVPWLTRKYQTIAACDRWPISMIDTTAVGPDQGVTMTRAGLLFIQNQPNSGNIAYAAVGKRLIEVVDDKIVCLGVEANTNIRQGPSGRIDMVAIEID